MKKMLIVGSVGIRVALIASVIQAHALPCAILPMYTGDGDGDGEGGDGNKGTFDQSHIDAAVAKALEGAGADAAGLKAKNAQLLDENAGFKKTAGQWKGMDFDEVSNVMKMFSNNEEAQLIKDGKFEDVVSKRMEKVLLEHSTSMKSLQESSDSVTKERDSYKSKYENKFIDDAMSSLAIKSGVRPEALKDIQSHGRNKFSIDKDGEIVSLNSDGSFNKTKDGDLLNPERFIAELKVTNPYYWPDSNSGGLGGDGSGSDDDLGKRLQEAAESGNMEEYNKIRAKMK